MKKNLFFPVLGVLFTGYITLTAYVIANQKIEPLLVCADSGGINIPFSKNLCRAYLFTFRGTEQDIEELQRGVGASFAVQGNSPPAERERILKYLLGKNLDINHIGMHQLTALHEAVLANSLEEVDMLLRNGANPQQNDKKYGLTPLDLAQKLQDEGGTTVDRTPVITLLKNYKQSAPLIP